MKYQAPSGNLSRAIQDAAYEVWESQKGILADEDVWQNTSDFLSRLRVPRAAIKRTLLELEWDWSHAHLSQQEAVLHRKRLRDWLGIRDNAIRDAEELLRRQNQQSRQP